MEKNIKVFSTSTCPYCVMAKDYLKSKGVEFEDIDVSKDHAWADKMIEKSGNMGVPQLWIGEKVIMGFDQDAIDKELSL